MKIIKINKSPIFTIVARLLIYDTATVKLTSETKNTTQTITANIFSLPNENYQIELATFPISTENEKFSIEIVQDFETIYLGKLMIVGEAQEVQNFKQKTQTKFYK